MKNILSIFGPRHYHGWAMDTLPFLPMVLTDNADGPTANTSSLALDQFASSHVCLLFSFSLVLGNDTWT